MKNSTRVLAVALLLAGAAPAIGQEANPPTNESGAAQPQSKQEDGYIGMNFRVVTQELARGSQLPAKQGVLVLEVRLQSPAAAAGLKERDVIIEWDGKEPADSASFDSILRQMPPGKKIVVKFLRDGQVGTTTITVGDVPPEVACLRRAWAKAVSGDAAGAIADCTEAIRLDPKDPDAYVYRGGAKENSGDAAGAIADCTEAIRINPKNAGAYYNRGLAKGGSGDHAGAIADFTEAIRLDPQNSQTYLDRGIEKAKSNDMKGAIVDFTEAIRLDPQNPQGYLDRGIAKVGSNDMKGAIADYTEAIRLDPKDPAAYFDRGLATRALGGRKSEKSATADFFEAVRLYTEQIYRNPNNSSAYKDRADAKERLGDKSGAAQDRITSAKIQEQAAFAKFQENAKAWRTLPRKPALPEEVQKCRIMAEDAFNNDKDFEKALKYYEKGLAIDPLWPDGQLNAALIAGELHRYAEAAAHMKRHLELFPDSPNASAGREKLYLWEGKAEEEMQKPPSPTP